MKDLKGIEIRPAVEQDIPLVFSLIKALAEYERLADKVTATEEDLRAALFGERPYAEALVAYSNGKAAGFALFFHNFSTFLGRPGIYLEDVFVLPELRGKGIGKALLVYLARLARQRNCGRLEWAVLNWNEPAINFYQSLGAETLNQWTVFRLSGPALEGLAGR